MLSLISNLTFTSIFWLLICGFELRNSGVYLSRRLLLRASCTSLAAALSECAGRQPATGGPSLTRRHPLAAVRSAGRCGGCGGARARLRDDAASVPRWPHGTLRRIHRAVHPLCSSRAPAHCCVRYMLAIFRAITLLYGLRLCLVRYMSRNVCYGQECQVIVANNAHGSRLSRISARADC